MTCSVEEENIKLKKHIEFLEECLRNLKNQLREALVIAKG